MEINLKVDLYFILKKHSLNDIFTLARKKIKNFDEAIYLKCLFSYHDVEISPIHFMKGFEKSENEIFSFIEMKTKEFLKVY